MRSHFPHLSASAGQGFCTVQTSLHFHQFASSQAFCEHQQIPCIRQRSPEVAPARRADGAFPSLYKESGNGQ